MARMARDALTAWNPCRTTRVLRDAPAGKWAGGRPRTAPHEPPPSPPRPPSSAPRRTPTRRQSLIRAATSLGTFHAASSPRRPSAAPPASPSESAASARYVCMTSARAGAGFVRQPLSRGGKGTKGAAKKERNATQRTGQGARLARDAAKLAVLAREEPRAVERGVEQRGEGRRGARGEGGEEELMRDGSGRGRQD